MKNVVATMLARARSLSNTAVLSLLNPIPNEGGSKRIPGHHLVVSLGYHRAETWSLNGYDVPGFIGKRLPVSQKHNHLTRRQVVTYSASGVMAALAGCGSSSGTPTPSSEEATVTVQLRNRDDQPREFEVIVNQGTSVADTLSGELPADPAQPVRLVATFQTTDEQHEFRITTINGQRGQTWDPTECDAFFVDGFIENGSPGFETQCQSN